MNFETGDIYHIYNQGNNRNPIFFSRENYLFFLNKINRHINPHADVIAWCLMPNHFHLMVYVHTLEIEIKETTGNANEGFTGSAGAIEGFTGSETLTQNTNEGFTESETLNRISRPPRMRDLNNSIGVLLRSYTRAIDNQEKITGSLFRKASRTECLTTMDLHAPSFLDTPDGTRILRHFPEVEYPQVCFNYIHDNPVKAGLVKQAKDWEFSSFQDYCGLRNGNLINRKRAQEFGLSI